MTVQGRRVEGQEYKRHMEEIFVFPVLVGKTQVTMPIVLTQIVPAGVDMIADSRCICEAVMVC